MGWYIWKTPDFQRSTPTSTRQYSKKPGRSLGLEPESVSYKEGFWSNYKWRLIACGLSLPVALFFLIAGFEGMGTSNAKEGSGAAIGFIFSVFVVATTIALPLYSWVRYRRMQRAMIDAEEPSMLPEEQAS